MSELLPKLAKLAFVYVAGSVLNEREDFGVSIGFDIDVKRFLFTLEPQLSLDKSLLVNILLQLLLSFDSLKVFWSKFKTKSFSSLAKWSSKFLLELLSSINSSNFILDIFTDGFLGGVFLTPRVLSFNSSFSSIFSWFILPVMFRLPALFGLPKFGLTLNL